MSFSIVLEQRFRLAENGTTVRTEFGAGVTTFLTLAYVLFIQPSVRSATGTDRGASLTPTCLEIATCDPKLRRPPPPSIGVRRARSRNTDESPSSVSRSLLPVAPARWEA